MGDLPVLVRFSRQLQHQLCLATAYAICNGPDPGKSKGEGLPLVPVLEKVATAATTFFLGGNVKGKQGNTPPVLLRDQHAYDL